MIKQYNILVYPCGTEIGLEIGRSLKNNKHFNLIGANSIKDICSSQYYDKVLLDAPTVYSSKLFDYIEKIHEKYKIDLIIPAHDEAIYKLTFCTFKLKNKIVASSSTVCNILRYKSLTYHHLKDYVKTPKIFGHSNYYNYPVFCKLDNGQGSKDCFIANDLTELKQIKRFYKNKKITKYIITEYLPGEEFTIDCFTDRLKNLKIINTRKREKTSNGISTLTISDYSEIELKCQEMAKIINNQLHLIGAWFFQVKLNKNNEPVLLEISSRIAGSSALHRVKGTNFIELALWDKLGFPTYITKYDLPDLTLQKCLMNVYNLDISSYKNIYIDYDDTLVVSGKVNWRLMGLLFKLKNANKCLHLITRHKGNLEHSMIAFNIPPTIFTTVNIVKEKENKRDYILKNEKSIFIDDSFSERLDVSIHHKNCLVFSLDAIECLINNGEK